MSRHRYIPAIKFLFDCLDQEAHRASSATKQISASDDIDSLRDTLHTISTCFLYDSLIEEFELTLKNQDIPNLNDHRLLSAIRNDSTKKVIFDCLPLYDLETNHLDKLSHECLRLGFCERFRQKTSNDAKGQHSDLCMWLVKSGSFWDAFQSVFGKSLKENVLLAASA